MLTAIILVCLLALSDCNRDNAIAVLQVPEEFGTPAQCFMRGQAFLASLELGRELREDELVKVICVPTHKIETGHQLG